MRHNSFVIIVLHNIEVEYMRNLKCLNLIHDAKQLKDFVGKSEI